MSPLASVSDVSVVLGRTTALSGINLTVASGHRVGVRGPNGSGKTTLLRLLATLIRPTTGSASVLDWNGSGIAPADTRRRIGYIGHTPALNAELSLLENLTLMGRVGGARVAAQDALEMVGLGAVMARPAKLASQGMLRRADLARILLRDPTLLLLDEPFTGLDDAAQSIVDALVTRTINRGGAAVVVSHDDRHHAGFDRLLDLAGGGLRS